jgi:hypothetical protein
MARLTLYIVKCWATKELATDAARYLVENQCAITGDIR